MTRTPSDPEAICGEDVDSHDVCVPGTALVARLAAEPFEVLESVPVPGTTPAKKVLVRFERAPKVRVLFKWRTVAPDFADAFNNSPRRELAAVATADVLFGESQDLVPHSTVLCLPRERYPELLADAEATFADDVCVAGLVTPWIYNAETVEELWDPERYAEDPRYRVAVARLNVLANVIAHGDSHSGNVLVDDEEAPRRVFLIDNGFAFSGLFNPLVRWFDKDRDWSKPVIPSLPELVHQQLLRVDPVEFDRLATVAVLRRQGDGWAVTDVPRPLGERFPPLDADTGVRRGDGVVQLGLTKQEIQDVRIRFAKLLETL